MNRMAITMLNGLGCAECGGTCAQKPLNGLRGVRGFGSAPPVIRFNTEPDKSADGRSVSWSCSDWITWHKALVSAFMNGSFASHIKYAKDQAIQQANTVFKQWWDKKIGFLPSNKTFCGYGSDFYTYFKSVGLNDVISTIASIVTPIIGGGSNVAASAGNVLTSGGKVAENVADTASNTSSTLKWLVPAAAIGITALVGFYLYKNYAKGNSRVKVGPATI